MIKKDMADIDALIIHDMQTNAAYLRQIATYLVDRKEPPLHLTILLLSLKTINYQGRDHIQLGVILDYIFAATNLHDDRMWQKIPCQDEVLSQGLKGMYSRILVGDFFYSRAFNLMAKLGEMRIVSHLSDAINQYTEGQSFQICQARDPATSEQMYFKRLKQKSCLYFNSITELVSILGHCSQFERQALYDYGFHLGIAVQIIEDTLCCIRANKADQDKQPNLPFIVIRGLQQASPVLNKLIKIGITQQSISADVITKICNQTDALAYTNTKVKSEIKRATEVVLDFPESIYRLALQNLATDLIVKFEMNLSDLGH